MKSKQVNERTIQLILQDSNLLKSLLEKLTNIFDLEQIEERVGTSPKLGMTSASKKVSSPYWTLTALQLLADDLGFQEFYSKLQNKNLKALGAAFDEKTNNISKRDPVYDIITWQASFEGTPGIIANQRVENAEQGLKLRKNANLSPEQKKLYEEYFEVENQLNYKFFCGPSSRGAKVIYAYNTIISDSSKINIIKNKELKQNSIKEYLESSMEALKVSPILPALALIGAYTGNTHHHTYYEVMAGTVGMEGAPDSLKQCDLNWLKILMTTAGRVLVSQYGDLSSIQSKDSDNDKRIGNFLKDPFSESEKV